MLSVGVAVDPNHPSNLNKRLKISVDYKVTMADVIIMVSDHDEEMGTTPSTDYDEGNGRNSEGSSLDVKSGSLSPNTNTNGRGCPEGGNETVENESPMSNNNISGSRSSRPSCHRTRTESQRSQLQLLESRSNIPLIHGATLSLKPCSYYRAKFNNEDPNYWVNASSLQKSAGQKVIKKINDQHRSLAAAEAAQQRKRSTNNAFGSLLISPSDMDIDPVQIQRNMLQMKKRPMKLEPLHLNRKMVT